MGKQAKVLIVAPHLDDEALSCGGLILDRVAKGKDVRVLCLYGRTYDYGESQDMTKELRDAKNAKKKLRYRRLVYKGFTEGEPHQVGYYKVLKQIEAQLDDSVEEVIIPSINDMNQDHRFLHDACKIATRPCNLKNVKRVLAFRSFDTDLVRPSYYVPLTTEMLTTKINAVNCYEREARKVPHPRAPANIIALHMVLGSYCNEQYAEGYDLIFEKDTV